jgi:hypothetical protein
LIVVKTGSFIRWAFAAIAAVALITGPAMARPHATPTPAPTPTPVADPAITQIARQQFVAWQAGTVHKNLYDAEVQAKLTDEKINDTSHALGGLGALTDTVFIGPFVSADLPPGAHGYIYHMICTAGAVYLWMIVDATGKIATIYFHDRLDVDTFTASPSPPPPTP